MRSCMPAHSLALLLAYLVLASLQAALYIGNRLSGITETRPQLCCLLTMYTIIPQRAYTHTQSLKHTVIASSSLHITKYFIGEAPLWKTWYFIHVSLNNSASTEYCIQTMFELHPHSTKSFIFKLIFLSKYKGSSWGRYEFFIAETLCIRSIQYFIEPLNDTPVVNLQRSETTALTLQRLFPSKYLNYYVLRKTLRQTAEEHMTARGASKHSIVFLLEGNSFFFFVKLDNKELRLGSIFAGWLTNLKFMFKALLCNDVCHRSRILSEFNTN